MWYHYLPVSLYVHSTVYVVWEDRIQVQMKKEEAVDKRRYLYDSSQMVEGVYALHGYLSKITYPRKYMYLDHGGSSPSCYLFGSMYSLAKPRSRVNLSPLSLDVFLLPLLSSHRSTDPGQARPQLEAALLRKIGKPVTFKFHVKPWGYCLTFCAALPWTPSEHETLHNIILDVTYQSSHYLTSYRATAFLDPMEGIAISGRHAYCMSNGF